MKQKLKDIFSKKTTYLSAKILLTALIFSLVFPLLAQPVAQAGPSCDLSSSSFAETPIQKVNLPAVSHDEPFQYYFSGTVSDSAKIGCTDADLNNYSISLFIYPPGWTRLLGANATTNNEKNFPLIYKDGKLVQKISTTLDELIGVTSGIKTTDILSGTNNIYAYFRPKTSGTFKGYFSNPASIIREDTVVKHNNPDPDFANPPISDINAISISDASVNNDETVNYSDIKTKIVANSNGKGLRKTYRVAWTDGNLNFGTTPGLDGIHMEWDGKGLTIPQYFTLPKKDDNWGLTFTPRYISSNVYFGFYSKLQSAKDIECAVGWTGTYCSDVIFRSTDKSGYGSGDAGSQRGLPNDFNPVLTSTAWKSNIKEPTGDQKNKKDGKPLGSNDFGAIPAIIGTKTINIVPGGGYTPDVTVLSGGGEIAKVTVEVYANDDDVKAACKNDASVTDKSKCDNINFAKFGFGDTVTQTTNPTEDKAKTAAQTLYAFILRVIISIILIIQTIIYKVFAFLLVPVLKAILTVRPYKDNFVNIIYPGWLILRNLANIFFIIALLVVGLKTLFQQAASSTTRSFITKLVLMALLVNFSLVISQGIVGIADTVQAQFLPDNSRVIEALGAKLMVEPLKSFRASTVGDTGFFQDTKDSDLSFADVVKPIVLLILTVAAFWSFVAIAAFLLVRLVVLWVLYMTSPIAYVFGILPETKSYASQWWKEFIRYVTITPVLVFFLNIAALMATVFADANSNSTQIFNIGDASTSSDLVLGVLTVLTHFIVLGVLFAGMKFAMSSGTYGAKAITGFAQKGFKNTLNKWPMAAKDSLLNMGANQLADKGFGNAAKALVAIGKPVDFAKAVKKAQWDDRGAKRIKANQDRINDTWLTRGEEDTSKLGSSLKRAKEKIKGFDSDDVGYLSQTMKSAAKKKDRDSLTGAMLKLGQDGKFKDLLKAGKDITRAAKYSENAAGLNAMTKDMVDKGVITEANRRDLLNEYDKAAEKKKKNAHYGGNVNYNEKSKKFEIRDIEQGEGEGNWLFKNNEYANKDSHLRGQIKGRTGDDPKGVLKQDLTQAHVDAAVGKDGKFTLAQIGVFAEESKTTLGKAKIWDAAREANSPKYEKMVKAVDSEEKRNETRDNMVKYYTAVMKESDENLSDADIQKKAMKKAQARTDIISSQLLGRVVENGVDTGRALPNENKKKRRGEDVVNEYDENGTTDAVGVQETVDDDDDDDGDDDDDAEAGTTTGSSRINTVTAVSQSSVSPGAQTGNNPELRTAAIVGDAAFSSGGLNINKGKLNITTSNGTNKKNNTSRNEEKVVEGFARGNIKTSEGKSLNLNQEKKSKPESAQVAGEKRIQGFGRGPIKTSEGETINPGEKPPTDNKNN